MFELAEVGRAVTMPGKVAAPGVGTPAKVDPKLVDGARQFEGMMLEQMLKPMHFGASPDKAGEEDASGSNDTLSGFGTAAVARALAGGGGFGLARQIIRQVSAEHEARAAGQGGIKVR